MVSDGPTTRTDHAHGASAAPARHPARGTSPRARRPRPRADACALFRSRNFTFQLQ